MRSPLSARAEAARHELERVRPGPWRVAEPVETSEGRAVVEYFSDGQRLMGKLFQDGEGEATFRRLEALYGHAAPTLRVARPVAWFAGPRVLVTEVATGRPGPNLHAGSWDAAMTRIGRALRELHGLPLAFGPAKRLADHVRELMRPEPAALARALPEYEERIRVTLEQLTAAERNWGELPVAPLHRDFHLRQLLDDGTHVTVLDWEDACTGDPGFDVGYWTAYLRTHHLADDAEAGIAAFRSGYGGDDALWARIPVYERFNYLRRACRRFRLQDAGWREQLEAMMSRLGD